MNRLLLIYLPILFATMKLLIAQPTEYQKLIVGSSFLDNRSFSVLQRLCDEAGGRLAGSPQNEKALNILIEELGRIGITARKEMYKQPGWFRGDDKVIMLEPTLRHLQAVALGFVQKNPSFTAPVLYASYGFEEDFQKIDAQNRIVLITSETPAGKEAPLRSEVIRTAAKFGAEGVLFINNHKGALNLAGTASFSGEPTPIPGYSLTYEEGMQIKRLLEQAIPVKITMDTKSYCQEIETANVIVSIAGLRAEKIVIGAHIDSWDVSQGGLDNGIGTAVLFEVARLIRQYHPENQYSIELVWFNAEELGLFGAKAYANMHQREPILAMINMDMPGSPTGFNAMGFDEFIPFLENIKAKLNAFDLKSGVISQPWTNSDHVPFLLQGIPCFTMMTHLDNEDVMFYHSGGDSFDKVRKKYLAEAAAVMSILAVELANQNEVAFKRLTAEQTKILLTKFKLDDRLKRQGEWIFDTTEKK